MNFLIYMRHRRKAYEKVFYEKIWQQNVHVYRILTFLLLLILWVIIRTYIKTFTDSLWQKDILNVAQILEKTLNFDLIHYHRKKPVHHFWCSNIISDLAFCLLKWQIQDRHFCILLFFKKLQVMIRCLDSKRCSKPCLNINF